MIAINNTLVIVMVLIISSAALALVPILIHRIRKQQRQLNQISERIKGDLAEFSRQRHAELFRVMDEVMLTVDMSRATTQAVRLGDVFNLDVPDWGAPLNRSVDLRLHVISTEIDTEIGERILECRVLEDFSFSNG